MRFKKWLHGAASMKSTILHARERRDAKFRGAANAATLHAFLESLGHLEVGASTLGVRKR